MIKTKINLACGDVFVSGDGWINLDYSPIHPEVKGADLLGRLPQSSNSAELVYSSHFLEHIPRDLVPSFLRECWRILAPGGLLRLVLPDLENLCRAYLKHRDLGEHDKADFVVIEMIDQCVRSQSGGRLAHYYKTLSQNSDQQHAKDLIAFVRERTGENLLVRPIAAKVSGASLIQRAGSKVERTLMRAVLQLLPKAFRRQNVSLACIGERHQWLWDFEQLRTVLNAAGFEAIMRCTAADSCFDGFPFQPLDLDPDGFPRKGAESMYVEARKPLRTG